MVPTPFNAMIRDLSDKGFRAHYIGRKDTRLYIITNHTRARMFDYAVIRSNGETLAQIVHSYGEYAVLEFVELVRGSYGNDLDVSWIVKDPT